MAVWDKSTNPSKQSDELVGYCKVNLQSGYTTLGQMTPEKVADFIHRNGDKLIEIVNQQAPVRGVALNDERGLLNVSVSVGSLRQIKAEADNDYFSGRPAGYSRPKKQKSFDSRDEEEVNETASDHNLDDLNLSSDESQRLKAESRQRIKDKKQNLKKLKQEQRKQFKEIASEDDERRESSEEEYIEGSSEEIIQPQVKKHDKDSSKPAKKKDNVTKDDPKQPPHKKSTKISSQKSVSYRDETHENVTPRHPPQLPSPKEASTKRQPTEPSEPMGKRPQKPSLPDKPKSKKHIPEEPSLNSIKVVLKENDKDIIKDPVTGISYQKLPNGEFSELKKVTVTNDDGKKEIVYINPNIDPNLSKKSQLSTKELEGLKAVEAIVNPLNRKMTQTFDKLPENIVHDNDLISRLSQQYLKTHQSLMSKKSNKSSRRKNFEYLEEDSEESEEQSEESDEKGVELQLIDKNRPDPSDQKGSSNRLPNSKGSLSKIHDKESSNNLDKNINRQPTLQSQGLLDKSNQDKPFSSHSKNRSQGPSLKNIGSKNDLDTNLKPSKSGPGVIADKSEVQSQEINEEHSYHSSEDENEPPSALSKFSKIGDNSTMLRPRTSKLEEAKNLKVPIKFGGSHSRLNEMVYTPKAGVGDKFSFNNPRKSEMVNKDLSLPQGFFDQLSQMESPLNNPKGLPKLTDQRSPQGDSNQQFLMDKERSPHEASDGYKPGPIPKPSAKLQEGTVESSDARRRATIPQFETLLSDDFFCDDILMTFTIILEYLRRFVFVNEAISERMDILFLGQFQHQKSEDLSFEDLEYIMQTYNVFITKTELESLFNFLDYDDTGEIKLSEIHDSLVAFLQIYETITFEFYDGFKELHKKIKQSISLEEFKDYLIENSEKFHLRNELLQDYLESYLEEHSPGVLQTATTCGDFIYYDQSYVFNLLNYLLFVEHYEGEEISFEYVNALHHYLKFRSLVEVKVVFLLYDAFKIKSPDRDALLDSLQARFDKVSSKFPHKINFKQFRALLKEIRLGDITVWESMILFKCALDQTSTANQEGLTKFSLLSLQDAVKFMEGLTLDKRGAGGNLADSQAAHSLLIEKHKKRIGQVTGEKFVYTYDINVEMIDDVYLARCDYSDLTVMYQFPGETEPIESGILTYIPDEHSTQKFTRLQCRPKF